MMPMIMPRKWLRPVAQQGCGSKLIPRNEKINYKVREHSHLHVPAILVVGRREAEEGTVAVRRLGSKDQEVLALADVVGKLSAEAQSPAVDDAA